MKIDTHAQYSHEWWQARRGVPTASNFSKIITPKGWQVSSQAKGYMCQLVADMHDPMYGMQEEYVSAAMAHGSATEPTARKWYEFATECEVQEVGFCTMTSPPDEPVSWAIGCSPDGLVGDDGGLELKCPSYPQHVAWLLEGGVPAKHLPQVHGCLVVTGRKWWDFASYAPPLPPILIRVTPDDKTVALAKALGEFCAELANAKETIAKLQKLYQPPSRSLDFGDMGKVEIDENDEPAF